MSNGTTKMFKVGEWVVTNNTGYDSAGSYSPVKPGGYGFEPNKLLRIRKITTSPHGNVYWFEDHFGGVYEGNFKHAKAHYIKRFKEDYERAS